MGNTQKNNISPTLLQFQVVDTHPLDHYKQIKHKKTGQSLLVKQIIPINNQNLENIKTIIEAKMHNKSTFVTQLVYWERLVSSQLCSSNEPFMLLFNNVGITLTEHITTMKNRHQIFAAQKLSNILQEILKGLKYYSTVHHLHHEISPDYIFFDGQKAILIDPWLTSNETSSQSYSKSIYKSPQKQLFQKDQIESFDQQKSNIYELGLLIIDLATNGKYSQQKLLCKQKTTKVNLGLILEGIEDFKLKSRLNILVHPNPDRRITIFNIMLPERITLKQYNPSLRKNTNFKNLPHTRFTTECTQASFRKQPKSLKRLRSQSIKNMQTNTLRYQKFILQNNNIHHKYNFNPLKNHSMEKMSRNRSLHSTPEGSIFTYAQLLPHYTQSNQTAKYSKKQLKQQTNSNINSLYQHQPHKILKIFNSHNTSLNSSSIKEPQEKSQKNYGLSCTSQDSPRESFINFLHRNNRNLKSRQIKDEFQDKIEANLKIIQEQKNSYITSNNPAFKSINLSREDSKIRLSQNPSYSNLSPARNYSTKINLEEGSNIKQRTSSIPQKIINKISNPTLPSQHIQSKEDEKIKTETNLCPKVLNISGQKNLKMHSNDNNIIKNLPVLHPILTKQLTKADQDKLPDKVQKQQSRSSSPPTPSFDRKILPFESFGKKQKKTPSNYHFEYQYEEQDGGYSTESKKIIRQINTQQQDWQAKIQKNTQIMKSMVEDSQQEQFEIKQTEQIQQRIYQKKQSKKQIEKKVSLKKLAQTIKQAYYIEEDISKNHKSYIKIVTPDKKRSIQEYQINITLNKHEDSGQNTEKPNNIMKDQKSINKNLNTSDLESAKSTKSIIFDNQQKSQEKRLRNTKKDLSLHKRNNLHKNISFGPKNNEDHIQHTDPSQTKRANQQSDFVKKLISMTNKEEQTSNNNNRFSQKTSQTINNPNFFKPNNPPPQLLENKARKLTISIETNPLTSIESVIDNNYGSPLLKHLKGFDRNSGSSPYLKNQRRLIFQKIQEKNSKIQQQIESAIIGDQLGYSQDYNNAINKDPTKKINKLGSQQLCQVTDSPLIRQSKTPFQTQNSIINKLHQSNLQSFNSLKISKSQNQLLNNQSNNNSHQSPKYYVIEKYPLQRDSQIFQKYQGYKSNSGRDGLGTYYYVNGDIYHGEWKNDLHHGYGGIYRKKKNTGSKIQDICGISQSIIDNRQYYYDTICEGVWNNGQLQPNIDRNTNNSIKNSSSPISPPSASTEKYQTKYQTSIINLLAVPLPIHKYDEDESFQSKKSLKIQNSIVNSLNFSGSSRDQQFSCCSIGKNQKALEFNPLNQIITLKNGDLFKGKSITNKDAQNQMKVQGKLIRKNGQIIEGRWLYKDNQLLEIY